MIAGKVPVLLVSRTVPNALYVAAATLVVALRATQGLVKPETVNLTTAPALKIPDNIVMVNSRQ